MLGGKRGMEVDLPVLAVVLDPNPPPPKPVFCCACCPLFWPKPWPKPPKADMVKIRSQEVTKAASWYLTKCRRCSISVESEVVEEKAGVAGL